MYVASFESKKAVETIFCYTIEPNAGPLKIEVSQLICRYSSCRNLKINDRAAWLKGAKDF